MKAPDKLYISRLIYETWQYQTPDPDDNTEVEYIRKDALMEWVKERREAVAKEVVIQEGVRLGADAAFEELIDKLNEM